MHVAHGPLVTDPDFVQSLLDSQSPCAWFDTGQKCSGLFNQALSSYRIHKKTWGMSGTTSPSATSSRGVPVLLPGALVFSPLVWAYECLVNAS